LQVWLDASEVWAYKLRNQAGSMVSERQRAANRANAKRSTGPKTAAGKLRSSRNALTHGLSASIFPSSAENSDAFCSPESYKGKRQHEPGSELAKTQSTLSHIRLIRANLVAAVLEEPSARAIKRLKALDRYERAALRKRRKAMNNL